MAWYNRALKAVSNAASRAVSRVFGGRPPEPPPPPPQPVVSSTVEPVYQPVEPVYEPAPAVPGTPEATMGLPAEEPIPSQETIPTTDWTGYEADEVTLYDPETYDPIETDRYMTFDDWYREALMPADYLRARYGINNIDILRQLEDQGYFVDWDQWRAEYEAMVSG